MRKYAAIIIIIVIVFDGSVQTTFADSALSYNVDIISRFVQTRVFENSLAVYGSVVDERARLSQSLAAGAGSISDFFRSLISPFSAKKAVINQDGNSTGPVHVTDDTSSTSPSFKGKNLIASSTPNNYPAGVPKSVAVSSPSVERRLKAIENILILQKPSSISRTEIIDLIQGSIGHNAASIGQSISYSINSITAGGMLVSPTISAPTITGNVVFDGSTLVIDSNNHRIGIGTTSPSDTLSVNGPLLLGAISSPANTADRLYNIGGTLYWNGGSVGGGGTGITSFGAQYSTSLTAVAQILATSSDTNIGLNINSSGSTHTFTPTWIGTLAVSRGGTGLSSFNANQLLIGNAAGTGLTQIATSSLGLLSTNISEGSNLYYLDSRVQSFIHGSTTIPKTYTANTFTGLNTFSGSLTIGSLNGPLQANAGVISASTSIGVLYGGTGLTSAPTFGQILVGNNAGGYTPTATSTLNVDISDTVGTLAASRGGTGLSSLTANQLLIGNAAGTGWTQVATSSLGLTTLSTLTTVGALNSGSITSGFGSIDLGSDTFTTTGLGTFGNILATGSSTLQNFTALLATTTSATTTNISISGSSRLGTVISGTWNGTAIGATSGGTGLSTITNNQLLIGGAGNTITQVATSSLGLLTTNVAEGSNLYYLDSRVQSFIHGSTTIPKTYTANTFTGLNTFSGSLTIGSLNGPLQANAGVISASTSIGVLYGGTGLTSAPTFGQILVGNNAGGYTPTATSSLGLTSSQWTTSGTSITYTGGNVGIGTTSPFSALSVSSTTQTNGLLPLFTVASTTHATLFTVLGNGNVGVATTSPSNPFSVGDSVYLGAGSASTLTIHSGVVNYPTQSTTTVPLTFNAWSIGSSTNATGHPVINLSFSSTGASSTIGFFVSTTTGLTAGTGMGVQASLQNYVIVGNGKKQAGMAIVNGGLCVDSDGWCTASTTGRISAVTSTIGGTDIAEIYFSDDSLEPGEVVAISSPGNIVKQAQLGNERATLGVIATDPGIILGLKPGEDRGVHEYPVALAGRIPTKVSVENGPIKLGDYLALSSTPGVAMKATKAGNVLGQALEEFSGPGTGKISLFVKNTYYGGSLPDELPGLTFESKEDSKNLLKSFGISSLSAGSPSSKIITDQLFAGQGIIAPILMTTNLSASLTELTGLTTISGKLEIAADTIFSGSVRIEHLSIGSLDMPALTDLELRTGALEGVTSKLKDQLGDLENRLVTLEAFKAGNTATSSPALMGGALKVLSIASLENILSLLSDTEFIGRPYFTSDTGGTALIRQHDISVDIVFEREYVESPIINATISFDASDSAQPSVEDVVFSNDLQFVVTKRSARGFTIILNKPAPADIHFNWIALAIKNSKPFTSVGDVLPVQPVPLLVITTSTTTNASEPAPARSATTTEMASTTAIISAQEATSTPSSSVPIQNNDIASTTDGHI
jgi:hypothetical protein